MGMFRGQKKAEEAPAAAPPDRNPVAEMREQILKLENTLASLMFGETKGLTPAQERWVKAARAKMTDAEVRAFPAMKPEAIYPLASELHKRVQADPATRYTPEKRGIAA